MSNAPQELLQALVSLPLSLAGALRQELDGHSRHSETNAVEGFNS